MTQEHLLLETRTTLLNEISLLGFKELNNRSEPNKWSIAQVCHHLAITEKLFARAIEYALKQPPTNHVKQKNIQVLLDRSIKVDAPEIVKPALEPFELVHVTELLNDSRTYLLAVLDRVEDKSILYEKSAKHPIFGELPLNQWIDLIYLHDQRHIEQIKEIKNFFGIE
ncbi:DinB family protein [Neobacillus rhizosphaerae]|uniref:DinB family protein n=1 Tax=Neobacillus rhizosphaerae TaxID=2880965 RepID=UPI003D2A2126